MLICPQCKAENPQHHNFCQSCGRSLNHYVCDRCGAEVDFDRSNCPECQAESGTYWWAIVTPSPSTRLEPIARSAVKQIEIAPELEEAEPETEISVPAALVEQNLPLVSSGVGASGNLNGRSHHPQAEFIPPD